MIKKLAGKNTKIGMVKRTVKICLAGASGKMGQEIINVANQTDGVEILQFLQQNLKLRKLSIGEPSVLIDFTVPEFFEKALNYAIQNKLAFISGTTGLTAKQKNALKAASKKIPVLWSSNMSLGICVLKKMLRAFEFLKQNDFYIEETHHSQKKDSPSGTALTLKDVLEESIQKKVKETFALRGGGVFGQHRIIALGQEEVITLQHDALNRTVFARGAVFGAQWISTQPKGFYTMDDVLTLNTTSAKIPVLKKTPRKSKLRRSL